MGMMLRRWRERVPEAEHEAEKPEDEAKKHEPEEEKPEAAANNHEPEEDKPEAAAKKPTKLKRAASSEK